MTYWKSVARGAERSQKYLETALIKFSDIKEEFEAIELDEDKIIELLEAVDNDIDLAQMCLDESLEHAKYIQANE